MNLFSKIRDNLFSIFQTALIGLLVVLVVVFVVVMIPDCPKWIFNLLGIAGTEEPKYEALKFLGIGMGGILIALQALMSYKRAKAMEQTAEAQADAARAQADAVSKTEQGQRQDRLKNAIEHLGHESDSVRLGGAYELSHLAEDTEDLCQTVLDILCAHIRRTTGESEYREKHKSKPSEEVQSLLTLLFVHHSEVFKDHSIELQGSWLNGADLLQAQMQGANLIKAHLQGVSLYEAHLQETLLFSAQMQGAHLTEAHLQKANLTEAHLQGADLTEAHLQGVDLTKAHLQKANLTEAHLQGANLQRAYLQEAHLTEAHLQGADLTEAHLQETVLIQIHLQGANLQGAHLQGADLCEASLQGANLRRAYLQSANLHEACLQGADLCEASLQGANLYRACLQGAQSREWSPIFAQRMRQFIGQESDLVWVIFEGGLSEDDVDSLVEDLPDDEAKELRERLTPHIGKPKSNQLPKNSHAITGSYTKEDAEKWIAEYEQAMSEVPEDDS